MHRLRSQMIAAGALLVGLGHLWVAIWRPDVVIERMGDDALFFVRYAHNFIVGGQFAWNLGEGPAFGSTSQLYLLLTTPLVALLPGREAVAVAILPPVLGLVAVALLLRMTFVLNRSLAAAPGGADAAWIGTLTLAFAALLLGFNPKFYQHWFSGMETTLSVAALAAVLACTQAFSDRKWYWTGLLPMMIVIQFWARPDLILITAPMQLLMLFSKNSGSRQAAWTGITLSVTGVALSMLAWWHYYGSPVPLPALIKTALSPYSRNAISQYRYGNVAECLLLIREDSIALLLAAYFFIRRPFAGTVSDIGLAAGVGLFVGFEMFGNSLPISSGGARFLMPALPILLWYAIRGFSCAIADLELASATVGRAFAYAAIGTTALLFTPLGAQVGAIVHTLRTQPRRSYVEALTIMAARSGKWQIFPLLVQPGLTSCSIADSEVGAIGVISPGRTIYDMSGLNNSRLAFRQADAASYLAAVSPAIMWYKRIDFYWATDLQQDPRFATSYKFYDLSGIAVLRSSPCAAALQAADAGRRVL
jgi:hypothetical protein